MNPGSDSGAGRDRGDHPDLSRFQDLLEGLDAIVWEADATTWQFTFVSRRAQDILGYPVASWLADPAFWPSIIHPEDRDRAVSFCRVATGEGRDHDFEYRALAADARVVWLRDIVRVVKDARGRAVQLGGLMVDVSEEKRAEEALRRAEQRYRTLFEEAPAMYVLNRREGNVPIVTDCNDMFLRTLGYTRDEVVGRPLDDFYTAGSRTMLQDGGFQRALEGRFLEEERELVTKDGRRIRTLLRAVPEIGPDGRVTGTRAMYTDVTALKEAEERYRSIFENAVEAIFQTNLDGRYTAANPALARMLGYDSPEELIAGVTDVAQLYVEPGGREGFIRQMEEHGALAEFEYQVYRKDGSPIWVSEKVRAMRDEAGRLAGFEGTTLDVTERKRAEEALREAEERYRTLVEQVPAAVYVAEFGEAGAWSYVSPQVESLLGFIPEEWKADPTLWARRLHPEDRDRALAEDEHCRRTGEPLCSEYRMLAKDGRVVWVRDEATVVKDEAGRPLFYQGLLYDMTERRRMEEDLHQTMESLRRAGEERRRLLARLVSAQEEERRRIASDIHDDPIQKMTAVGLRLHALKMKLHEPVELRALDELAGSVELAIARLRHLLFELRPPALDRDGLSTVLRQHLEEMCTEGGSTFELEDRLVGEAPDDTRSIAYRIAHEALANVRKHAKAKRVDLLLESRDGGLFVRIRDDGAGFSPDLLEAGRPGHLGLTAMRERAELAGGWCRVTSAPGSGAAVEFWLPVRDSRASLGPQPPERPAQVRTPRSGLLG